MKQAALGLAVLGAMVSVPAQAETYWARGMWNVTRSASICSLNTKNGAVGSLHLQMDGHFAHAVVSFVSNRQPALEGGDTAYLKVYFRDNQIVLTDWGGTFPFKHERVGDGHFYAYAPSSGYKAVFHAFANNAYIVFTDAHDDMVGVYPLKGALRGVEKLEECAATLVQ